MTSKRCYDDACAGAHALNIVGERWALLVVRELLLGPRRFSDLRRALPGISANVLSQRLDELIAAGVVVHQKLPPPVAVQAYDLTEWGKELEDVICRLGRWGARSPALPREAPLSANSLVLSMRTMFDAGSAENVNLTVEVRVAELRFAVRIEGGVIDIACAAAQTPDAVLDGTPEAIAAFIYDGITLDEAVASGGLAIEGDRRALELFASCFSLPEPFVAPVAATAAP